MGGERETLDIDVLFVGAGPASLAGAYHLAGLLRRHNQQAARPLEISIAVLEKGREIGSHALSGAVVDPRAFAELFPRAGGGPGRLDDVASTGGSGGPASHPGRPGDRGSGGDPGAPGNPEDAEGSRGPGDAEDWRSAPFEAPVGKERVLFLTAGGSHSLPIPPPLRNHGCYVASLGKLVKWMAPRVEAAGVDIFYEFPAAEALVEDGRVVGVRTGDRGIGKHGEKKANYEPGIDIRTRCVVLGEGPRGALVKQLDAALGLSLGRNPQVFAIGLKEVWDLPPGRLAPIAAGDVIHTLNWPLGFNIFGGGFIYGMQNDQLIVGLVVGLDYSNPLFDPFLEFQRFKTHPAIAPLLAGGKLAFYGAKAIPEGGWWSLPQLGGEGFLLIGDAAGFLNSQRLKGIHLAMKSGMLAAEAIFEQLAGGADPAEIAASAAGAPTASGQPLHLAYQAKVESSWIRDELWPVRNFHQAFDHGLPAGMLQAGLGLLTGGRGWGVRNRLSTRPGHERLVPLTSPRGSRLQPAPPIPPARAAVDGTQLVVDRLADVYMSGTAHEEDQPVHLHVADPSICVTRCTAEYANPCERFCPAAVYEMVADPAAPASGAAGKRLQINAANCVHCKTCDIMDPYGIITWVPPEGGGGPNYSKM
jgi:electron-transferring-flavoprotein dehydrogenase